MKDYYEILGVKKNATADEIKRAYRRLAHQHHPDKVSGDKTEAEKRFKEINEAYQVLSDQNKRARYDQFGHAGVNGPGAGGFDGRGGFDPFGGFGSQQGGFQFDFGGFGGGIGSILEEMMGSAFSTVQAEVRISLTQALLGDTMKLQLQNGEAIELRIPPGTQDGQTFVFRGKGNPHRRGRGDLQLTVRVQLPRRLTREQRELVEKLRQAGL